MIDYADVQGTVLRGYRVDLARHFVLSVADVGRARTFLGQLADGTDGVPKITTAARWTVKPECFVNVGFTSAGLAALGVDGGRRGRQRAGELDRRAGRRDSRPRRVEPLGRR